MCDDLINDQLIIAMIAELGILQEAGSGQLEPVDSVR